MGMIYNSVMMPVEFRRAWIVLVEMAAIFMPKMAIFGT